MLKMRSTVRMNCGVGAQVIAIGYIALVSIDQVLCKSENVVGRRLYKKNISTKNVVTLPCVRSNRCEILDGRVGTASVVKIPLPFGSSISRSNDEQDHRWNTTMHAIRI